MVWGKSRTVSTRKVKAITEELCGPQLFGVVDQCDEPAAGREPGTICWPAVGRSLSLSDPRRTLRAGARGRCDCQPGGADRDQHRRRGVTIATCLDRSRAMPARARRHRGVISSRPVEPVSTAAGGLDSLPAQYLETI